VVTRREQDLQDGLGWGLSPEDAEAYAQRGHLFDINSRRLTALGSLAGVDTAVAMLDMIIALRERVDHLEAVVGHPAVVAFLDAVADGRR
jgi:hypothetical protein